MGKSSTVKNLNRKRSNKKKSTRKRTRKRTLKGGGLEKKSNFTRYSRLNRSKSSRSSNIKTYHGNRLSIRSFNSGTTLHYPSDKYMIENIKDYKLNGCDSPYLLYNTSEGHSNITRGIGRRKLTFNELITGTHHVTRFTFNFETWLLIETLDGGGQQVVGHIQFRNDEPIHIYSICTRKQQGYGKILLYSLFKYFKDDKRDYELYSLHEARGFYNKIGFKADYELTHEPGTWNDPGDLIIQSWQIDKILRNYRGRIVKPS